MPTKHFLRISGIQYPEAQRACMTYLFFLSIKQQLMQQASADMLTFCQQVPVQSVTMHTTGQQHWPIKWLCHGEPLAQPDLVRMSLWPMHAAYTPVQSCHKACLWVQDDQLSGRRRCSEMLGQGRGSSNPTPSRLSTPAALPTSSNQSWQS